MKPDILWRNYGTGPFQGWNSIWYMDGTTILGEGIPWAVSDTNWRIEGIADFNGDLRADILWRNYGTGPTQGFNSVWYMNGANIVGEGTPVAITDTDWQIAGSGDFNGDGKPDFLWRNYGTGPAQGRNSIWYMDGMNIIGEASPYTILDTNWRIEGTGDFDSDGKSDIVWRYYGAGNLQGSNVIWYMDGQSLKSEDFLLTIPDLSWRIVNN